MIVAVTSWRGTGATTTALALSRVLADHGQVWLVEADVAGGVLAGRLGVPANGGLPSVVLDGVGDDFAERMATGAVDWCSTHLVVTAADPFTAHACHRHPWSERLAELPGHVVVDAGRHRAGSPAWPLLLAADQLLVVSSAEVAALVASVEWLRAGGRSSAADPAFDEQRARIVVSDVPGGVAFPRDVVRADLGRVLGGWLPFEPAAVQALHHGASFPRFGRAARFWREVDSLARCVIRGTS